tara:strand:- start:1184 stop:1588 length:405 start_codon:yes stop_codon:yes gene_type:complete
MGTLRATLSLASADVLSSPISVSVSSAATADSGLLSRAKILKTAVHDDALKVYKENDKLTSAYLYVKNLDTETEKYVYLYNDANSNDVFAKLAGGEFCFVPVAPDQTIKAYATRVDTLVEYGVFGLDSSAVTLA